MRARFVFEAKNIKSKYYAPDYLIQELMEAVNQYVPLNQIDEIIEPAAGDGALIPYIDFLANSYNIDASYYDLDPDPGNPRIKRQDFLTYTPEPYHSPSRLIITGPPYGEPGATARLWKEFAQKASEIAGYVAFISPVTWLDVQNPVPNLELIFQKDMGTVLFRGSEAFGGKPSKVKTAILIYKSIDEPVIEDFSDIEGDFLIQEIYGRDNFRNRKYDYYILSWGRDSGTVNTTGQYPDGRLFSKAIGIKVLNEARRDDLEEFLETFEETHKEKIERYSINTNNILSVPRFKRFLREALYSGMNESVDFEREGDAYRKLRIGRNVTKPYPQMSVQEFVDWYEREIFDYNESDDFDFQAVLSDIVNDEVSTDDELREVWTEELDVPKEVIDKILPMRGYFLDFRYIQNL